MDREESLVTRLLKCMARLVIVSIAVLAAIPPVQTMGAGQPPVSTATCPKISREISFTCFAPGDLHRAEGYLHPKPVDPSSVVTGQSGIALHAILVVWCQLSQIRSGSCQYRRAESIYYIYGSGSPSIPTSQLPPFIWVSESPNPTGRTSAITLKRQGATVTSGVPGGPSQTTNEYGAWILTLTLPERRLKIGITSNQDALLLMRMALALAPWGQ